MKLLHITNHYPPYTTGPADRQCRLIVNELANRGHFNRVLTSTHRTPGTPDRERFAMRQLYLSPKGLSRFSRLLRAERHNRAALAATLEQSPSEAVVVWGMAGLSNSLLWQLQQLRQRVIYAVLNPWPRHRMRDDPWFLWWTAALPLKERAVRRLLRTIFLSKPILDRFPIRAPTGIALQDAFFASRALRDSIRTAGYSVQGSEVIPYCINRDEIPGAPQRRDEIRRLLWIGRLDMENDPMTAIQAIQELRHGGSMQFSLDIFGKGDVAFASRLHDYIRSGQLAGAITIRQASVEDMISIFPTYDAFLHTARFPDAFPTVLLRAMSARLPIVTTVEGSSADVVRNTENALTFRTSDPVDCAEKVLQLASDRERLDAMTDRAYRDILDGHSTMVVTGRIERLIHEAVQRHRVE